MKKDSKHTFSILAYKESPYLEECILSLKKQTVRSELFIATSTPSQYLEQISKEYEVPIRVNHESIGIGSDWTFAYNNAETQYVTLAHQDDIYSSEYTERCLEAARKINDSLIIFTDYNELVGQRLRVYTPNLFIKMMLLLPFFTFKNSLHRASLKKLMLSTGSPISCPSVFFNKKSIGTFEFSNSFSVNLDWEAWLRLARMEGAFVFIKKKLLTHRIHKDSQTTLCINNEQRYKEDEKIFQKLWPIQIAKCLSLIYRLSYLANKGN